MVNLDHLDVEKLKNDCVTKYGKQRRKAIRRLKILERDNFKCTTCGRSNKLTIAHIVPIGIQKRCDHKSFKMDECKTQCVECHLKEEEERYKQKYGFIMRWMMRWT